MLIKFLLNGKEINLTGDDIIIKSNNFNVNKEGTINCTNANIQGTIKANNGNIGNFEINEKGFLTITEYGLRMTLNSNGLIFMNGNAIVGSFQVFSGNTAVNLLRADGGSSALTVDDITARNYNNLSLESYKKNISKFKCNAIETIKKADIYTFNYKNEDDSHKKHIGFIIGKNYSTPKEIVSNNKKSIDIYSFISLCCKAIQEQQEEIEKLKKKIEEMEEKINGSNIEKNGVDK